MAQLFTVLFFAAILGTAIAAIWSVIDENLDLVMANMPWKARSASSRMPAPRVLSRRPVRTARAPYCATPSRRSETPTRAITVSPAMVR